MLLTLAEYDGHHIKSTFVLDFLKEINLFFIFVVFVLDLKKIYFVKKIN